MIKGRTNKAAYLHAWAQCNESERRMLDALLHIAPQCLDPEERACVLGTNRYIQVIAQHRSKRIGRYVLDFAVIVTIPGVNDIQINVECDGHEFHNMTKDQVKRDLRRNRHLRSLDWIVERFSGSEIWADADACVSQIEIAIDNEFAKRIRMAAEMQWEGAFA